MRLALVRSVQKGALMRNLAVLVAMVLATPVFAQTPVKPKVKVPTGKITLAKPKAATFTFDGKTSWNIYAMQDFHRGETAEIMVPKPVYLLWSGALAVKTSTGYEEVADKWDLVASLED